jgi:hypothetical protein
VQPWIKYTLIRVGLFAVLLALLLVVGTNPYLATGIAAVVALCISYIFFGKLRAEVGRSFAERRRNVGANSDSDVEDAADDAAGSTSQSAPGTGDTEKL